MNAAASAGARPAESVAVRFFGSLREAVGQPTLEVAPAVATVAALKACLRQRLPAAAQTAVFAPGVKVAVNQEIVDDAAALAVGDEVALLPPVTGG